MTIRKNTGRGGADAVARNASAAANAERERLGAPPSEIFAEEDRRSRAKSHGSPKGRRAEVLAAQQTPDSGFGKPRKPDRPTADEVEGNIDGAGNVPFEGLPPSTQGELARRRRIRDPAGMFKGEDVGFGVRDPETGRG